MSCQVQVPDDLNRIGRVLDRELGLTDVPTQHLGDFDVYEVRHVQRNRWIGESGADLEAGRRSSSNSRTAEASSTITCIPLGAEDLRRTRPQPSWTTRAQTLEDFVSWRVLENLDQFPPDEVRHRHAFDGCPRLQPPVELHGYVANLNHGGGHAIRIASSGFHVERCGTLRIARVSAGVP